MRNFHYETFLEPGALFTMVVWGIVELKILFAR